MDFRECSTPFPICFYVFTVVKVRPDNLRALPARSVTLPVCRHNTYLVPADNTCNGVTVITLPLTKTVTEP